MKRINLYFKDNAYTNATGDPSTAWHSIYLNEEALICCLFKDAANAGIDLSAGTLEYASDKDYKHEGDPMLYAFGLTNVPGWSDPANGKVAFTVSAFNAAFATKLGANATLEIVCNIKQLFEGGESVIASFKMNAVNIVHLNQGEPEPGAVDYYTAAQTDALFAAGYDSKFSATGGEDAGHTTQAAGDKYIALRNKALSVGGVWTSWIKLPDGVAGTVTIGTVTTLDPDEDATVVNVGTPQAAVLDIGIPQGAITYRYVAFASAVDGTGFSLTASDSLPYRAEFSSTTFIETPVLSDFTTANAVFVRYIPAGVTIAQVKKIATLNAIIFG